MPGPPQAAFSDIALSAGTGPDGLCTAHSGVFPCIEHGLLYHGTELPGEPVQSGRDTAAKGTFLTGKLLAALLGFQRISAAQLDRTALRTGQFLTGTIPIVGQSLSDASEAVLAGIQLLKSGLGMAAILILLAEFLPLYLGMLAHLGCIVLCGTLCSLTGNSRGQALLTCFASAVRCMMACIALFFGLAVTGTALLFMLGGV